MIVLPAGANKANYPYRYELEGQDALTLDGGRWSFIGYYENDLTGRAIHREFTGGPCQCSADPHAVWGPEFYD